MERGRRHCVFSAKACRDCPAYRGRHWFLCHPDASWGVVCGPKEGTGPSGGDAPWYEAHFPALEPGGLSLDDVAARVGEIDWDFWPEQEQGQAPEPGGKAHFAIDVWCGEASLRWMESSEDGRGWISLRLETGVPPSLLREAVLECGGQLLLAGVYPLNGKVKAWLQERLASP